jgi:hypothetical protein
MNTFFSQRFARRRRESHAQRLQVENAVRSTAHRLGIVTWSISGRTALLVYAKADREKVHGALRLAFARQELRKCYGPSGGLLWGPSWCKCAHDVGVVMEIVEE